MAKTRKNPPATAGDILKPLLITRGQFFVIAEDSVTVHVLTAEQTSQYYEGMRIAETRTRPDQAIPEMLRMTFGIKNARLALPAPSTEALHFYVDHYDGPLAEAVKGLAACILTGTPFGGPDDSAGPSGGIRERVPISPDQPGSPGGATFALQAVSV